MTSGDETSAPPTCAVIICTRDRPTELEQCLTAIASGHRAPDQILVADNADTIGAARTIAMRFGAEYTHVPVVGLSRARNAGARLCRMEVAAYLDDDARADPAWLVSLLVPFRDPRVTVVTGRCVPDPDSGTPEIRQVMARWWKTALEDQIIDNTTPNWEALAIEGGLGTGANMAFRREVLTGGTGFDERLGAGRPIAGFEEHEAFFACLLRGGRLVYTPEALICHPVPKTLEACERFRAANRAAYVAYIFLLFAKYPEARRALARVLRRRIARNVTPHAQQHESRLSTMDLIRAVVKGCALFLFAGTSEALEPPRHDRT